MAKAKKWRSFAARNESNKQSFLLLREPLHNCPKFFYVFFRIWVAIVSWKIFQFLNIDAFAVSGENLVVKSEFLPFEARIRWTFGASRWGWPCLTRLKSSCTALLFPRLVCNLQRGKYTWIYWRYRLEYFSRLGSVQYLAFETRYCRKLGNTGKGLSRRLKCFFKLFTLIIF